jgi:hypothetical protein
MHLYANWRVILKRAWSIRLMALATILTGMEATLPFLHSSGYAQALPGGTLALLSCGIVMGAFVSRLVAQKGLSD